MQTRRAVGSRMVTSAFALFLRMYVVENEQELYCQTISMGKFFDIKKRSLKFPNLALESL